MDRFEEFIVKKYPNRSPKVLLQKLQDIDETWFYAVKEVQDQSEVWQLKQAEIDEKDKRIEELENAFKHLGKSINKSISFEHNLFDKGWNSCAERVVEDIYRLTGIGKALRGECE